MFTAKNESFMPAGDALRALLSLLSKFATPVEFSMIMIVLGDQIIDLSVLFSGLIRSVMIF